MFACSYECVCVFYVFFCTLLGTLSFQFIDLE